MLSYLHAYHAGNYADVLKHTVLVQVLHYLTRKDKPLCYFDTHSGAGLYKLNSKEAATTEEYRRGVASLWATSQTVPALDAYLQQVKRTNYTSELRLYPGSGLIAAQMLRPTDRLILCELHPREAQVLTKTFAKHSNVRCYEEDGFAKAIASLPPIERRGVMLIDPSYEVKTDYAQVVEHLQQCHRRFATGVYLCWYPVADSLRTERMLKAIRNSGIKNIDLYEVGIEQDHTIAGMTGAGMVVVNPTFGLAEAMGEALPVIAAQLGGNAYYKQQTLVEQ